MSNREITKVGIGQPYFTVNMKVAVTETVKETSRLDDVGMICYFNGV